MPKRFFPGGPIRQHAFGWEWLHFIFMLLVLAAIVMLAVWLIQSMRRPPVPHEHATGLPRAQVDAALQEARMRYARGEMSRDEFVQISIDLGGSPGAVPPAAPSSE